MKVCWRQLFFDIAACWALIFSLSTQSRILWFAIFSHFTWIWMNSKLSQDSKKNFHQKPGGKKVMERKLKVPELWILQVGISPPKRHVRISRVKSWKTLTLKWDVHFQIHYQRHTLMVKIKFLSNITYRKEVYVVDKDLYFKVDLSFAKL